MGDIDNIEQHSCCCSWLRMFRPYHHYHTVLSKLELKTIVKRNNKSHSPILPDDLIIDILLRLPVRSLLQFKCVCKSWKTLISTPQFAKNQLRISTVNPRISLSHQQLVSSIITQQHCQILSSPVKPLFENPSASIIPAHVELNGMYRILGSCNGLLCLYNMNSGYVRLWNLSTGLCSKSSKCAIFGGMMTSYGFGYDHVNDKYKMLVVVIHDDLNEAVTKVYSFAENSWKTIQNFPFISTSGSGKFVNGTLNWVAMEVGVSCNQWVILTFDLEKETYRKMLLPKQDDDDKITEPELCVLSNCLCVYFDLNKTHFVLWLMKEYGVAESWTKLMMIPNIRFWFDDLRTCFKPLCISDNGVVLSSNLVIYDANADKFEFPGNRQIFGRDIHVYHESLVSPLW